MTLDFRAIPRDGEAKIMISDRFLDDRKLHSSYIIPAFYNFILFFPFNSKKLSFCPWIKNRMSMCEAHVCVCVCVHNVTAYEIIRRIQRYELYCQTAKAAVKRL